MNEIVEKGLVNSHLYYFYNTINTIQFTIQFTNLYWDSFHHFFSCAGIGPEVVDAMLKVYPTPHSLFTSYKTAMETVRTAPSWVVGFRVARQGRGDAIWH